MSLDEGRQQMKLRRPLPVISLGGAPVEGPGRGKAPGGDITRSPGPAPQTTKARAHTIDLRPQSPDPRAQTPDPQPRPCNPAPQTPKPGHRRAEPEEGQRLTARAALGKQQATTTRQRVRVRCGSCKRRQAGDLNGRTAELVTSKCQHQHQSRCWYHYHEQYQCQRQ